MSRLKLFQNIIEKGILLKSFYEATIILITKPDKGTSKKKKKKGRRRSYKPISLMNIDVKLFQQNISGLNQTTHKKWWYDMIKLDSPQVQKGSLIHANQSMWYIPFT